MRAEPAKEAMMANHERSRRRPSLTGILPLIAFAVFLGMSRATRAGELFEDGGVCKDSDNKSYTIGSCIFEGCWWWQSAKRCGAYGEKGAIQWSACNVCE